MRALVTIGCVAALGAGLTLIVLAQTPGTGKSNARTSALGTSSQLDSKEDADVLLLLEKLAKAFEAKNAKAFAACWSEKAEYFDEDEGERLEGRQAIEADFTETFATGGTARLEIDVTKLRRISPDVASVEGIARVVRAEASVNRSKFLALLVRDKSGWLIDSVRESNFLVADANASFLEGLAWLDGSWSHKNGDTEVTLECTEVANGNFRSHRFRVKTKGEVEHEGTQIVGWDASKQQLRSWVFSSDGSFADGWIDNKGDTWTFRVNGVLPDGAESSATQILTRKGDNQFTWQVLDRHVGTRSLPNVPEITLVKSAPMATKKEE